MNLDPLTRQSRDVVRELIADGLAKPLAAVSHRSLKQIYRWAEHWDELCVNPLERVARMIQLDKKRRIIHWLCAQAGGTFQPKPEPLAVAPAPLPVATVQLFGQIRQFESTVAAAEAAGPVTITQARRCAGSGTVCYGRRNISCSGWNSRRCGQGWRCCRGWRRWKRWRFEV